MRLPPSVTELVQLGQQVLWTPTATLVQELLAAKRGLHLPQAPAKLDRYVCVFLDDIGYVQHDRDHLRVRCAVFGEEPGSAVFDWAVAKGAVGVGPNCSAGSLTTTYSMCRRWLRSTSSSAAPAFALR
jgi:hypothetical protein